MTEHSVRTHIEPPTSRRVHDRRRAALVVGTSIVLGAIQLAGPRPVADACSILPPPAPRELLGVDQSGSGVVAHEIPANAAGLEAGRGEPFVSAGATLHRIPPGTRSVEASGVTMTVSELADTEPPTLTMASATWIQREDPCAGCAFGSAGSPEVVLEVHAEDDWAPAERISYAVYLGATDEAAIEASAGEPELWLLARDGEASFPFRAEELPQFVIVRAFDQAGNASAASAPMRVPS